MFQHDFYLVLAFSKNVNVMQDSNPIYLSCHPYHSPPSHQSNSNPTIQFIEFTFINDGIFMKEQCKEEGKIINH
jgi:hypothetical protein